MSEFFDYDPFNGLTYKTDYDWASDEITLHTEQDVQPFLDHAHRLRSDEERDRRGRKNDFWLYAVIPPMVEVEILNKHGIKLADGTRTKDLLRIINTEYPHLKATNKTHAIK
jgi:hypothetical protein